MPTPKNISGPQIRFFRKKIGLSQNELAAKAQRHGWDIGRDVVVKVETGTRCVDDIEIARFARLLEVTPNDLLPGQPFKHSKNKKPTSANGSRF